MKFYKYSACTPWRVVDNFLITCLEPDYKIWCFTKHLTLFVNIETDNVDVVVC